MELYLVTGFLGAGKTTCIQNILKIWEDKKVALIINEFGKQGVDGKILETEGVMLEEITNGSIFCTCKLNHLQEVLEELIKKKPDVILIEASGLSDPTHAYEMISQERFREVIYKGCICIVDAKRFEKVIHTATVSRKQVRIADQVIINKTDLVSKAGIDAVRELIAIHNPYVRCEQTCFGQIEKEWIINMDSKIRSDATYTVVTRDLTLQKYSLTISESCTEQMLRRILRTFIEDTHRIKGFVTLEGRHYLVDCVGDTVIVKAYHGSVVPDNQLVALASAGMSLGKSLKSTQQMYSNYVLKVES